VGDLLDLAILIAVAGYGFSGYRQGLIVGSLSLVGFVGGGLLGAQLATPLARSFGATSDGRAPGFGVASLVVGAVVGQVGVAAIGVWVRRHITWRPLRLVDGVSGALIAAMSVLLVSWALGQVAVRARGGSVSDAIRHSEVLKVVDETLPAGAQGVLAAILRLVDNTGFPRIFGGFDSEDIVPVAPPDPALLALPGVRNASAAIVKVKGDAPSCSRTSEGSGFVFARDRVMTNAHVLAGVHDPKVITTDHVYDAEVVLYDAHYDIAVLRVLHLPIAPLAFHTPVDKGADAAVIGYPEDGPFSAVPARVRSRRTITGPDIYQSANVTREVYILRSTVLPGNSGGPMLAPDGTVDGVVFAASVQDKSTGYALTAAQVAKDATAGTTAAAPVSTQGCD
jgi:S1-C subfamily serine protease